ncbi:MAG: hypothetical protein IT431_14500 [Phycisphaerales bacterium]|nr:hypothetical protein [Phycisphaerales bacterium]
MTGPKHRPARSMKAVLIAVGVALLLAGVAGVVLLRTTGIGAGGLRGAGDRLEEWVGSQVVGIANSYLVPQIGYEGLDYRAPGTVVLEGVSFTAPDGTRVLGLDRMTVTLAEVPKIGEPITIETIRLERPVVRLIREVGADGEAGFKGLRPIVKRGLARGEAQGQAVEENFRLSNVLRLREVELIDGEFVYDQGDGSAVMEVGGLTTTVRASPEEGAAGWYRLDIESALGPLAQLSVDGEVSLDSFEARIAGLRIAGHLTDESVGTLPPEVQALVRRYEAQGQMELTASGDLALTDPLGGTLSFGLGLRDFRVASGEYQAPIASADLSGGLAGGVATVDSLTVRALDGEVRATGSVRLREAGRPAEAFWTIDGVELRELLRANTQAEGPPKLAGRLRGNGRVRTALDDARGSLSGEGEVHLREGRLLVLPGLMQLASVMRVATEMRAGQDAFNHEADASFTLGPAGVEVTASEVHTEFLAARGTGTVGFDGSLDLAVNGGPLEKVQSLLGGLGDAIGAVTDRLVKYRVRGTVAEPRVTVDPLGVGG